MSQADDSHTTIAPTTPASSAAAISAQARQLLEQAVECLIAFIDLLEPDSDLEDNGDSEPSLGWPIPQEKLPQRLNIDAGWSGDAGDDREHDTADNEASLGSLTSCGIYDSQEGWAYGNRNDCEEQCEDEGAEHDGREDQSWSNPMGENRVGEVRS